jgi:hypothetical protein
MKVAFDIHGVIDKAPGFFSEVSKLFRAAGHQVYILTGSETKPGLVEELKSYGMEWDFLFSITDHHKNLGVSIRYDENGNPWIDDLSWDKTKAEYCEQEGIDFCFDDTLRYGDYFKNSTFIYTKIR